MKAASSGKMPAGGDDYYAQRTYASPYWIVRFPHRRRFAFAAEIVDALRPQTILDYGAGDGHFLVELLGDPARAAMRAVALEPLDSIRRELESASHRAGLEDRISVWPALPTAPTERFDLVVCMGVLEHLTVTERHRFYEFTAKVLAPGGSLLIDVPVEHGATLLVKNFGRRVLKRDAREYTLRETLAASVGRVTFDSQRWDPSEDTPYINSHKGFDHRLLRAEVGGRFAVERVVGTPLSWLPPLLGNQEVFIVAGQTPGRPGP